MSAHVKRSENTAGQSPLATTNEDFQVHLTKPKLRGFY